MEPIGKSFDFQTLLLMPFPRAGICSGVKEVNGKNWDASSLVIPPSIPLHSSIPTCIPGSISPL